MPNTRGGHGADSRVLAPPPRTARKHAIRGALPVTRRRARPRTRRARRLRHPERRRHPTAPPADFDDGLDIFSRGPWSRAAAETPRDPRGRRSSVLEARVAGPTRYFVGCAVAGRGTGPPRPPRCSWTW